MLMFKRIVKVCLMVNQIKGVLCSLNLFVQIQVQWSSLVSDSNSQQNYLQHVHHQFTGKFEIHQFSLVSDEGGVCLSHPHPYGYPCHHGDHKQQRQQEVLPEFRHAWLWSFGVIFWCRIHCCPLCRTGFICQGMINHTVQRLYKCIKKTFWPKCYRQSTAGFYKTFWRWRR